jgi:CRISPR/Cas system-associated exonuclease Cas4 (RecB family)
LGEKVGVPSWFPRPRKNQKALSTEEINDRLAGRYGIRSVKVSDVAEQLYCEKKVELRLVHPELIKGTAELLDGLAAHEELAAEALPVSEEQFRAQVARGERVLLRESLFSGKYKKIPMCGKPDLVWFEGGKPFLVVEYKFSAKREPYPDHRLQVSLYGFLLHQGHFDTRDLVTILAFVPAQTVAMGPQGRRLGENEEKKLLSISCDLRHKVLRNRSPASTSVEIFSCFAYPFNLSEARRQLDAAAGFWLGKRTPLPTRHQKKCLVCEFNAAGLCPSALVKPSASLIVERKGTRILVHSRSSRSGR